jgi:hypothetical protein
MAFLRLGVRAIVLAGFGAASAQAQTRHAQVIVAPQGQPRVARMAPPPPPRQPLTTYGQTVFSSYPVIVTADGRVLVDLGNGYEQVARNCPYAYGSGCQSYGYPIAPFTPLFDSYAPPTYVAPRYAPPAYPVPNYPAGGYGGYPAAAQPGYVPQPPPPPAYAPPPNPGGCPPGYVPTGSYPPCIDPSRSPLSTPQLPAATTSRGAARGAAPRSPAPRSPAPRVIVRR